MKAICILSWRSPEILEHTLKTYQKTGLLDLFDEILLFLQEATAQEISLAKKYSIPYLTSKSNIGIENAWRQSLKHLKSKQVLMLEDDCPVIETNKEIRKQINTAEKLLTSEYVNIVRMRSTNLPGEKFNTIEKYKDYYINKFSLLKRTLRPNKARKLIGSSIYLTTNPDQKHPEEIKKYNAHCYITDSRYLNWTNQSVMFNKNFVLNTLLERVRTHPSSRALNGFQDIERSLNCKWWRKNIFPIAVCKGLFTHSRNQL